MHRTASGLVLALGALLPALAPLRGQSADPAYRFVLDYDVPESPALVAIGSATGTITRGSAAKPFVAQLVNQFQAGEKVANGLALDLAPYFLYGGRLASIQEYRRNPLRRILANSTLSLATAQDASDSASLVFGIGVRATLFDAHDLLQDPELGRDIDDLLAAAANAEDAELLEDDVIEPAGEEMDFGPAYARARARVRNRRGGALSLAWAMRGILKGSIASGDSIQDTRHTAWLAYRYALGGGTDLLAQLQWRQTETKDNSWKGGAALRANTDRYAVAVELFFDSDPDAAASGRLGAGVTAELRVTRGVSLVGQLATEPVAAGNRTASRVRLRTSVRWNATAEP